MEKDTKIIMFAFLILLIAIISFNFGNKITGKNIRDISGMPVGEATNLLEDYSFENWLTDYSLSKWNIDRRGQAENTVSKSTEHIKTGSYSVKFDLTGTNYFGPELLVKQLKRIEQNKNYEFSIYAWQENPRVASGIILLFGNANPDGTGFTGWTSGTGIEWVIDRYNQEEVKCRLNGLIYENGGSRNCTLDTSVFWCVNENPEKINDWIKIVCRGNSGDYTHVLAVAGSSVVNKVWFDDANLLEITASTPPMPTPLTTSCGDGKIQRPNSAGVYEGCDGTSFGDKTCITKGFDSGVLSCTSDCMISTSNCVSGATPPIIPPPIIEGCPGGCLVTLDGKERCFKFGARYGGNYCGLRNGNYEMIAQIVEGNTCEEDFECESNLCIGKCVSYEELERRQEEQTSWIKKLVCKLFNPLSDTGCTANPNSDYCKCISS